MAGLDVGLVEGHPLVAVMHRPQVGLGVRSDRGRHPGDLEAALLAACDPPAVHAESLREERLHEPGLKPPGPGDLHVAADLVVGGGIG